MKKLKIIACMFVIMLSSLALVACGKNDEKVTIKSASTNLNEFYYVTDTIDWTNVTVTVNYSNNKSETLTNGEFDIETKYAKTDTKWILTTDGLKNEPAGNMTAKTYNLTLTIIGNETTYPFTIKINKTEALVYEIDTFEEPECIATFKTNTEKDSDGNNVNGFKTIENAKYYVGDDNAFDITPNYTLYNRETNEQSDYKIDLDVIVLLGNAIVDENYYTYSDGKVDFTENAVGNDFTIKVKPTYFSTNKYGYDIEEVSFSVSVKDGYNIYTAKDLGMLSIVPENLDYKLYARENTADIFYNTENNTYFSGKIATYWSNFLTKNGYTNLQYVKGAFIHNNINIKSEDLPSEFFITSKESTDGYATGKLRDQLFIYSHYMQDDFTFEGNYFTISTKDLPVNGCVNDSGEEILTENGKPSEFGHTKLFDFVGYMVHNDAERIDLESNQKTVTVQNINTVGNTNGIISTEGVTNEQIYACAGAIIMFQNLACSANVNNVNISSAMIGWFVDTTDGENNVLNPEKSHKQKTILNNMTIKDCFNSGLFLYGAQGGCEITNSSLARFGGPAIHAVSVHLSGDNSKEERGTHVTYDDTVEIENYVGENEAWFNLTEGANGIATQFKTLDTLFNAYGKTILTDGKFNLKVLFMDESYLTAQNKNLHGKVNNYDLTDVYLRNVNSQGAPFIWTNNDDKCYIYQNSDKTITCLNNLDNNMRTTALTGNELNLVYPAGNAAVGIIVALKDYLKQA